jgi:hypothetical protein
VPRLAEDGSSYSWPDGELVTPDKLAAWLKEDILMRRVVKRPRRHRPRSAAQQRKMEQQDGEALAEAESLAKTLEVPLTEAVQLLAEDREGYTPPRSLLPSSEQPPLRDGGEEAEAAAVAVAAAAEEGTPFTKGTVDAYIAAVIELWRLQVAHGNHNTKNPRGVAFRGFLKQRGRQRSRFNRETFQNRGTNGIQAGYSAVEWLRIQDILLSGAGHIH